MRTWSRVRVGAALLGAGAVLAAGPVVPDPVLVETVADLPPLLQLAPAVQQVAADDDGTLVVHHVENGLDVAVEVTLAAEAAAAGPDGGPTGSGDRASGWRLPADRVVLEPGDRARVTSVATDPGVVRLTATPATGDPLVAYVVVAADREPAVALESTVVPAAVAVALRSEAGPTVVEARVRAGPALLGRAADRAVGPLVLLPETTRHLRWELDLPPVPWPTTVSVDILADGRVVASSHARVWPEPVRTLAVVLSLAALLVAAGFLVRRRRRSPGP